jgi:hypothetical protein
MTARIYASVVLYPFSWSSLSVAGTLRCHHFQSVASRLKTLPDADVTNVESYDVKCQTVVHLGSVRTYEVEGCYFPAALASCLNSGRGIAPYEQAVVHDAPGHLLWLLLR